MVWVVYKYNKTGVKIIIGHNIKQVHSDLYFYGGHTYTSEQLLWVVGVLSILEDYLAQSIIHLLLKNLGIL